MPQPAQGRERAAVRVPDFSEEPPGVEPLGGGWITVAVVIGIMAALIAIGGMVLSFRAVSTEMIPAFGRQWSWLVPIVVDLTVFVFSGVDLVLARMDMSHPLARWTVYGATAGTVYLNYNATGALPGRIAHVLMPSIWVMFIELMRHVVRRLTNLATGSRREPIPTSRWLVSPWPTLKLWRRMVLWRVNSYPRALEQEKQRLGAIAAARHVHGRAWRWRVGPLLRLQINQAEITAADVYAHVVTMGRPSRGTHPRYATEPDTATGLGDDTERSTDRVLDLDSGHDNQAEAERVRLIEASKDAAAKRAEAEAHYEDIRASAGTAASEFDTALAKRREQSEQDFAARQAKAEKHLAEVETRFERIGLEAEKVRTDAERRARQSIETAQRQADDIVAHARADTRPAVNHATTNDTEQPYESVSWNDTDPDTSHDTGHDSGPDTEHAIGHDTDDDTGWDSDSESCNDIERDAQHDTDQDTDAEPWDDTDPDTEADTQHDTASDIEGDIDEPDRTRPLPREGDLLTAAREVERWRGQPSATRISATLGIDMPLASSLANALREQNGVPVAPSAAAGSRRPQSPADKARALRAKHPTWTLAQIAARLEVSDRTISRYLNPKDTGH